MISAGVSRTNAIIPRGCSNAKRSIDCLTDISHEDKRLDETICFLGPLSIS